MTSSDHSYADGEVKKFLTCLVVDGESTLAGNLELGSIGSENVFSYSEAYFLFEPPQPTSKMANSITSQPLKARPVIMAGLAAGLAVTGALYGAGLKQQQETKKEAQVRRGSTPVDRIAILEQTRSGLTAKKKILETKIAEIEGRATKPDGQESVQTGRGRPF